jgi:hypothetical protein
MGRRLLLGVRTPGRAPREESKRNKSISLQDLLWSHFNRNRVGSKMGSHFTRVEHGVVGGVGSAPGIQAGAGSWS